MNSIDENTLLTAVRSAVNASGGCRITRKEFLAHSKLKLSDLFKHFPTWTDALTAAGFPFESYNKRIEPDDLLMDWGVLTRRLRRLPTRNEYKIEGKYAATVLERNFGQWSAVPGAFRRFANSAADWADVLEFIPSSNSAATAASFDAQANVRQTPSSRSVSKSLRLPDRPTYGAPIDFRGLRHAPVNENGVIFVFGMVARELGYLVESVQVGFPDCEAKRQIDAGRWQRVRIEFEFESRNFRDHGHAPAGCDLIVCWIHNWAECPETIDVVELSSEIKNLGCDLPLV